MLPLDKAKELRAAFEKACVEMPECTALVVNDKYHWPSRNCDKYNPNGAAGIAVYTSDDLIEWLGERFWCIVDAGVDERHERFVASRMLEDGSGAVDVYGPTPSIALANLCIKVLEALPNEG